MWFTWSYSVAPLSNAVTLKADNDRKSYLSILSWCRGCNSAIALGGVEELCLLMTSEKWFVSYKVSGYTPSLFLDVCFSFPRANFFQVYCTVTDFSWFRIRNTVIPIALMLCSYGIIVWGLCLPSLWLDKTGNLDLFKSQKGTLPMTVMTVSCSYHLEQGTCSLHPELNRVNMAHEKLRPTLRTSRQTCPIVFATLWRGLDIQALILFIFLWHQYSWCVGGWMVAGYSKWRSFSQIRGNGWLEGMWLIGDWFHSNFRRNSSKEWKRAWNWDTIQKLTYGTWKSRKISEHHWTRWVDVASGPVEWPRNEDGAVDPVVFFPNSQRVKDRFDLFSNRILFWIFRGLILKHLQSWYPRKGMDGWCENILCKVHKA